MTTATVNHHTANASSIRPAAHRAPVASKWAAFRREAAAFWTMLSDAEGELNRTADEVDATEPAMARRLRKAARQSWGWGL